MRRRWTSCLVLLAALACGEGTSPSQPQPQPTPDDPGGGTPMPAVGGIVFSTLDPAGASIIHRIPAIGAARRTLGSGWRPRWLPDGSRVLFTLLEAGPEPTDVYRGQLSTMSADGSDRRPVGELRGVGARFLPDGSIIFVNSSYAVSVATLEGAGGLPLPALLPLAQDGTIKPLGSTDWADDGRVVAWIGNGVAGEGFDCSWVDFDPCPFPSVDTLFTRTPASERHPAWAISAYFGAVRLSPDGAWVAATVQHCGFATSESDRCGVYVLRPDGTDRVRLRDAGVVQAWSPDGQWVLLSNGRRLEVVARDGSSAVTVYDGEWIGSADWR